MSRNRVVTIPLDALHVGQAKLVASIYRIPYPKVLHMALEFGMPVVMKECDEYQSKRMGPEALAQFEERLKELTEKAKEEEVTEKS